MPAETNRSRLAETFHGSAFDFLKAIANDRSLDMATRIDAALALGAYVPKPRDCLPDTNNRTVLLCRITDATHASCPDRSRDASAGDAPLPSEGHARLVGTRRSARTVSGLSSSGRLSLHRLAL
jgi:hypothetical protein